LKLPQRAAASKIRIAGRGGRRRFMSAEPCSSRDEKPSFASETRGAYDFRAATIPRKEADVFINLLDRLVICNAAIAIAVLATPVLAFDNHPSLRDDGARWAAANMPTAMPRPAEDQGTNILNLGVCSESELVQQIGFAGHVLRLTVLQAKNPRDGSATMS
jgi:hypothetical protein